MDYKKDIDLIIEKALTEKTFTLEIIDEIKKLRELPDALEKAKTQIDVLLEEKTELLTKVGVFQAKEDEVKTREATLVKREREQELKEVEFKWKDYLLADYKNMMSLVFRNTTIRESRLGSVPVESNGYIQTQSTSEHITKEVD